MKQKSGDETPDASQDRPTPVRVMPFGKPANENSDTDASMPAWKRELLAARRANQAEEGSGQEGSVGTGGQQGGVAKLAAAFASHPGGLGMPSMVCFRVFDSSIICV